MITAVEAREKTFLKNNERIRCEIDCVEMEINVAVDRGERRCYVTRPLLKEVVEELQKLGYAVTKSCYHDQVRYCISW